MALPQGLNRGKPVVRRGRKAGGLVRDGSVASTASSTALLTTRMEVFPKMAVPFLAFRMRWMRAIDVAGVAK